MTILEGESAQEYQRACQRAFDRCVARGAREQKALRKFDRLSTRLHKAADILARIYLRVLMDR
jgi:hypothetical protein